MVCIQTKILRTLVHGVISELLHLGQEIFVQFPYAPLIPKK